jgi:5'(3')-deoxyribonucleotidase
MISIAVDLDDVLNDLQEKWIKRYNIDYDDHLEGFEDWDVIKCVKPECGKKIFDYLKADNFFRYVNIKKDAREVMQWLNENFELYIVTSAHYEVVRDKALWIKHYLPFMNITNQVVFCHPKHLINTDYLIDDGPHNVEKFGQQAIVFDTMNNRHLISYPRVHNWLEVKAYFEKVLEESRRPIHYH